MTTGWKIAITVGLVLVCGGVYLSLNVPSKKDDIPLSRPESGAGSKTGSPPSTPRTTPGTGANRAPATPSRGEPVKPDPKLESAKPQPSPDLPLGDLPRRSEPQLPPLNPSRSAESRPAGAELASHATPTSSPVDAPLTPGSGLPGAASLTQPPIVRTESGAPGSTVTTPPGGAPSTSIERPPTPISRTSPPAPTPRPVARNYAIVGGDTLSLIAEREYGEKKYWPKIKAANPNIDANRLLVGTQISLPPKEEVTGSGAADRDASSAKPAPGAPAGAATETEEPPHVRIAREREAAARAKTGTASATSKPAPAAVGTSASYVVVRGDTLSRIARVLLKDERRWRELYDLNRDRIKDPNNLLEGATLRLPGEPAKPGNARPADTRNAGAKPTRAND